MRRKRTEGKNNSNYGTTTAYKNLIHRNPNYADKVSKELHQQVLHQFFQLVGNKMVEEAYMFSLPRIGTIRVVRRKIKPKFTEDGTLRTYNLPIDFNETLKLWERDEEAAKKKKVVIFTNDHTDGWRYTFKWHRMQKRNINYYRFVACRRLRRQLAAALKDVYKDLSFFGK